MSYNALVGGIPTELNRLLSLVSQRNAKWLLATWSQSACAVLAACRLGVACVMVYTHMRVVKIAALAVPYEQENALALQRSENPTYFLTSIRRWVYKPVFDATYDLRSEFSQG